MEGVSDAQGRTSLVESEAVEDLKIEVFGRAEPEAS